jgi:transposase-like protein
MAQHFTQSKAYRDLTDEEVSSMTDEEAWKWFCIARWGSWTIVVCPSCNQQDKHYFIQSRRQWRCRHCYRHFSVTSETPFAKRRLPFKKLLKLVYWFAIRAKGKPSNETCGELGVTFRTAWQNISKIREAMFHAQNRTKMTGLVHVDGGHFGGKPRRENTRQKMESFVVNHHLKNRKAGIVPPSAGYAISKKNRKRLEKRRIVMPICLAGERGEGTQRTITCVLKAENAKEVTPAIMRNVMPGTMIYTDAGNAYSSLLAVGYEHEAVNHSVCYVRPDGVNNNLAESFISRLRRSEIGTYHGIRPQYLAFYAAEMAWREDTRKLSMKTKVQALLKCIMNADISQAFRGYIQGHHLGFEYLG